MSLTAKQQAIRVEYPKDWNKTQAAIRAGYSSKWANKNLPQIYTEELEAAIKRDKIKISKQADVEIAEIIEKLRLLAQLDTTEEGQYRTVNNGDILKACELLGRYKQMWKDVILTDTTKQRELTDKEKAEARRIADIRLQEAG